jgi:hypothetical protein
VTHLPAWLRGLAAALPDLGLAAFFVWIWREPLARGEGMVGQLLLLMLLEFIIVHASGFMAGVAFGDAPRRRKVLQLFGLGLLESIFVVGFSAAFKSWWPLATFWGLVFNRMLGVLLNPVSGDGGLKLGGQWALNVVFYLGGCFLTLLAPVPRLGITEAVLPKLGLTGGGIWIEEPWRVLAFGAVYYAAQGIWAFAMPFLFPRHDPAHVH